MEQAELEQWLNDCVRNARRQGLREVEITLAVTNVLVPLFSNWQDEAFRRLKGTTYCRDTECIPGGDG